MQKPVLAVQIPPPPTDQRARRPVARAAAGEKRNRYHAPNALKTHSPVGYRTRISLTQDEAQQALSLLSLARPESFEPNPDPVTDQELFESCAVGILTSRQSTNFRGHRQISLGPTQSARAAEFLRQLGTEGPVLDHAATTHVVLSRPYRTAFTLLLTLIGHAPVASMVTVPIRALRKRLFHRDDIPTIGYLQHLHIGILADAMDRAAIISSGGKRRAQVFSKPFVDGPAAPGVRALEELVGLTAAERRAGWRIALVAQEGQVSEEDRPDIAPETLRKLGANLMAFRSERIQPGVNAEDKAPPAYQSRQDMDVPEELVEQAGRALYNAFEYWTGIDRDAAKKLVLLERVDVLTPGGKERIREIRQHLSDVTDQVVKGIPLWADLPTGRAFSRNAARGKKAFALAGQRIYIGGLSKEEVAAHELGWLQSVRALGAASARSALVAEIMGATEIPEGCDLLAGICLMAGPVNQNDVGKQFFNGKDLLYSAFPDRNPTSMLVWTLKAKTVADPIGNEQQLMDAGRKGALVDLRPGPHEVVEVMKSGQRTSFRGGARPSSERAFADMKNFVVADDGSAIEGNEGEPWQTENAASPVWE